MDFITIASTVGFFVTVSVFFGWDWRYIRYRALRFAEYPEMTADTSSAAVAIFVVHTAMATAFGFCAGSTFLVIAGYVLFHPETPYRGVAIAETLLAAAVLLSSGYCAGSALERTYRRFFPEKLLDEQLRRRGHTVPDELKERREAR